MNKKTILVLSTLIYSTSTLSVIGGHPENPHPGYTVMSKEELAEVTKNKQQQLRFLEECIKQNEANEAGFTKTNLGIGTMALGVLGIMYGIKSSQLALIAGGGLSIFIGGGIAHTATTSRRESEKQARNNYVEITKNWDDFRARIRVVS